MNDKLGNLRRKFCADQHMNASEVKFFLHGQRIHDEDTANTLGLINGDVIEVFSEMTGGGWPPMKNIYGDDVKIRDILNNESDDRLNLSEDENERDKQTMKQSNIVTFYGDAVKIRDILDNESDDSLDLSEDENERDKQKNNSNIVTEEVDRSMEEIDPNNRTCDDTTSIELTGCASPNLASPAEKEETNQKEISEENQIPNIVETNMKDQEMDEDSFVKSLRNEYEDGKLLPNNLFDKKIIHFLKLPTLAPIEQEILKSIVEQKVAHKQWQDETENLFPKAIKKKKIVGS